MPPRPTPLLPARSHHHPAYTIPHLRLRLHVCPRPHPHPTPPPQPSHRTFTSTPQQHLGRKSQDHYATLGVSRGASSKEIKASFYQLSKKYHPDLNRLDEEAKRKFQEVGEAWGVLGSERGRREYDRQLRTASSSYSSSASAGGPHQNYTYDPGENAARRARASYAWEYQRRRGDSFRGASGNGAAGGGGSRSRRHTGFYSGADEQEMRNRAAYARARGAFGSGMGDADSASAARSSGHSLFERYAAQQRRREEFVSSRATSSSSSSSTSPSSHPYSGASGNPNDPFSPRVHQEETQGASPLLRFAQVIGTLTFIFLITGSLGSSGGGSGRLRAEGSEMKVQQDQRGGVKGKIKRS